MTHHSLQYRREDNRASGIGDLILETRVEESSTNMHVLSGDNCWQCLRTDDLDMLW